MWNELHYDAIKFIGVRLPFLKDFLGDYKIGYYKSSLKLSDLKKNLRLRVLLIKCAKREKQTQTKNELGTKVTRYQCNLTNGQAIIHVSQKEKESLTNKLHKVESKAKESVTIEWKLQIFLIQTLDSQRKLKNEISILKETYNIYFKRVKESMIYIFLSNINI